MRTKLVIAGITAGCAVVGIGIFVWISIAFGTAGAAVGIAGIAGLLVCYVLIVRPWHSSWGASPDEVRAWMPGDGIVLGGASTTRAVTIAARPEDVWPWLVQIGYGRAGWYSYDWIDNDGKPSADRIVPGLQDLRPGDTIEMLPGWGPVVRQVVRNSHLLVGDVAGGTWCLSLRPGSDETTRLVSRWRQAWEPKGPTSWFFVALSDPGAFVMERKMLLGIKERAERAAVDTRTAAAA